MPRLPPVALALLVAWQSTAAQGVCSSHHDLYSCNDDLQCKWCSDKLFRNGACQDNAFMPSGELMCGPTAGCASLRAKSSCDANAGCKFCTSYSQGWTFCANVTSNQRGSADCGKDKPASACSGHKDTYSCNDDLKCKWCTDKSFRNGACQADAYVPSAQQMCAFPSSGCSSLRTNASCDASPKCKFCASFEQGWTFCTNITDDQKRSARCDKKTLV
jgi:hypothetical protein